MKKYEEPLVESSTTTSDDTGDCHTFHIDDNNDISKDKNEGTSD